jgi:superfamily II DNA or RNA helicase
MLRDYQIKAINEIESSEEKNILLQMATGSGKTHTFTEIARRYFASEVKKVLIVVHRNELLHQAKQSLGERCFSIADGVKIIPHGYDYYVGMVETVKRRLKKLPQFGLVIADEAHIANFNKLPYFEDKETKVLGVTATPIGTKPLSNIFQKMIMPTSIKELIENKYLLNADVWGVASDLVGVQKFKTKGGDFDTQQLDDFYSSEKMVENLLKAYKEISFDNKCLIFNVNLHHNNCVYSVLKLNGYNVYSIDGETPLNKRKSILNSFKNESNAILCNVGVLTTGFDEPSIQTIFLNRATKSLALYLQMIGRGARTFEGKDKFTIIDLGKNTSRFGMYDEYRDWENIFKTGTGGGDGSGVAPTKECPSCGFIQHTRKLICENCGFSFEEEKAKQEAEEKEHQFYLLSQKNPINIPTERLFGVAEERNWKEYAVLHKIAEHIVSYQQKHKKIIDDKHCESFAIVELQKWCEKYKKKNNSWHRNYLNQLINEKRSRIATGNSSLVQ